MAQTGGGGGAMEESRARLQKMLGLYVAVHVQYARCLWDLGRGDLGGEPLALRYWAVFGSGVWY